MKDIRFLDPTFPVFTCLVGILSACVLFGWWLIEAANNKAATVEAVTKPVLADAVPVAGSFAAGYVYRVNVSGQSYLITSKGGITPETKPAP